MKKTSKLLSLILALTMVITPISVSATTTSSSAYTSSSYVHQTKFDDRAIMNGIDVSYHNGTIDWNNVAASGIKFAFIRVGYTGYTKDTFSLNYDTKFESYISGALKAGIAVGVYWYSQALTTAEAETEAQWVLSKIGGYNITMPVVFDYEFSGASAARLKSTTLSKAKMTANTDAFCSTIKAAGYTPCVYASKSFFEDHLNATYLSTQYKIWLAHYTTSTSYAGEYDYWQYSSKGKVSGISGNVDCNFWYTSDAPEIENQTYTGNVIEPKPIVIDEGAVLVENVDYVLGYSNNINVGSAKITVTGIGAYAGVLNRIIGFKIVPPQVTGLTYVDRTKTSLTLKWNATPGADGYTVYIVNNTKGTAFTCSTAESNYKIGNLTDTNYYTVRVSAYKGSANYSGSYSEDVKWHTSPGKVSSVKVAGRTSNAVRLSWKKKSGATGYKIYRYYPSTKKSKYIGKVTGSSTTTYRISKLKSSTTYYYYVKAYVTDNGKNVSGSASSKVTAATRPAKVTVKSIKSSSKKKIKVQWNTTRSSGYQIQYSTSKSFKSNSKTVSISGSSKKSKTLTTKKSKKKYYVRVRGYKTVSGKKIYGDWSSTKAVNVK